MSNFKPDARGVRAVYSDLNQAMVRMRRAKRKAKSSPAAASALPEVRALCPRHCSAHAADRAHMPLSRNLRRTQLRNNFLRGFRSAERDIRQRGS